MYNSVGFNRQMVKQEGVVGLYCGFGMVDKLREHKWYVLWDSEGCGSWSFCT